VGFFHRDQLFIMSFPIQKTDAEWQALLKDKGAEPGALQVTRNAATERPFTGKYEAHWADGSYHCICCGAKLFDAAVKFDAGCGCQASRRPCPAPLRKSSITATAWCAPKPCVRNAGRIWAMCSRMAPHRQACATA
jgi:hypothetical protein